jgi:hypothetical protein
MTIKTKKTTEHEINIETPFYAKDGYGVYAMVKDSCSMKVWPSSIMCFEAKKAMFNESASEIACWEKITEEEFYDEFRKVSDKINSLAGISNVPTLQLQDK